ncbi:hypothetical protein FC23_GL000028 [Lactobacillus psittaci DSM 15354]|uniref:Uncharacterized protein n=1 Tax=Lactobacillus psittaci DSM 15354 TaxID=1122152 RepID=A0A0R1SBS2_9LACO|nr:hypothetical protein FC23_GL000028 [Lactobacillus psittaci DSM 15354]
MAIVGILIVAAFITVKINNSGSQNINVNSVKISSRALKSLPIRSDNTFQVDANLSKITFDNKEKLTNMSNENLKRLNYIQFAALILNFGKNELRNQDYQQMWNVAIKSKQLKVSIIPQYY